MLISYRWLIDYLEPIDSDDVIKALRNLGLYASYQYKNGKLKIGEVWSKVLIGEVRELKTHPTKEGLIICKVFDGKEVLNIVTGAKNLFIGAKVPVAPIGTKIMGEEITLKYFDDIPSQGMLCSEWELEISNDAEGIMILPEEFEVGKKLSEYLGDGDFLIEVEIPSNRGDCLSYLGIARELSAYFNIPLKIPEIEIKEEKDYIENFVKGEILDFELCPRLTLRLIKDVKVEKSPFWLRWRLERVGIRSINNVVDVTNFLMLETGQPLHAYDFDLLKGNKLIARRAKPGEKIVLINDEEKVLDESILVIADTERPVGIGGIMGGKETEISKETRNVLLEAANFNPINIRRSARKLGLRTEASLRFERGVDILQTPKILDRAGQLINAVAGGRLIGGKIDIHKELPVENKVFLRPSRVNKILGTELKEEEIVNQLLRIGFQVISHNPILEIKIPSYRQDIKEEIDLIEEIARFFGYDNIPTLPMQKGIVVEPPLEEEIIEKKLKSILTSLGLTEVINYSFISRKDFENSGIMTMEPFNNYISLTNPLSEEISILRTSLLPSLLKVAQTNTNKQRKDVFIFEIGKIFLRDNNKYREEKHLGILLGGEWFISSWNISSNILKADFYDLKGIFENIFEEIWGMELNLEKSDFPFLHPVRQGIIVLENKIIGFMGEVNPLITQNYDLRERIYYGEVNLDLIPNIKEKPKFKPLPLYPGVKRDLALLVPENIQAKEVEKLIKESSGELLYSIKLFDLYKGEKIEEGYKSLAFSLFFVSLDHTLTDEEVDSIIEKILLKLREIGIFLRMK
ncbi:MAG: phenylalanine--tRNA ligase subunit beta [Dictyoglomus sp.]|nr:phenylalanine--tRNA ligase subunit beta [Dictyoglomus sp.]MCX7941658.1 phenylalanine--tRNA ligase subunit beta [Dictyoglomaceae bacterium]MDW8188190.1 phenylalanine--tRNA ligase subunit beta [Dictyoglomus sp.]